MGNSMPIGSCLPEAPLPLSSPLCQVGRVLVGERHSRADVQITQGRPAAAAARRIPLQLSVAVFTPPCPSHPRPVQSSTPSRPHLDLAGLTIP